MPLDSIALLSNSHRDRCLTHIGREGLIRSLLDRALSAHREGSEVGDMTALLLGDIACETLLKQVLTERGASAKGDSIGQLVEGVSEAVAPLKGHPAMGWADRLRRARNPVQHAGQAPAHPNVGRLLEDAQHFAEVVAREAFGCDFNAVSAAELVQTPDLRRGLTEATSALKETRFQDAVNWATAVFDILVARWQHWSVRAFNPIDTEHDAARPGFISGAIFHTFGAPHPELSRAKYSEAPWREEWTLLSLGFSPAELLRIQPLRAAAEQWIRQGARPDAPLVAHEVAFFIELLARHIWRLEVQAPEMLRPTERSPRTQ